MRRPLSFERLESMAEWKAVSELLDEVREDSVATLLAAVRKGDVQEGACMLGKVEFIDEFRSLVKNWIENESADK